MTPRSPPGATLALLRHVVLPEHLWECACGDGTGIMDPLRAAGHQVEVIPARCKQCDFVFSEEKLAKPSRCPACKATRLYEPMIRIARAG